MTLRDRILTLKQHGDFDDNAIAAILDVDIADVERALTDPGFTPAGPVAGGAGPVVRKFPFAFDTPNILNGAALYTPTPGDILLDAWIEVATAWNGTSPLCDVMQAGGVIGWFNAGYNTSPGGVDMTAASSLFDDPNSALVRYSGGELRSADVIGQLPRYLGVDVASTPPFLYLKTQFKAGEQIVPLKFTTDSPVSVFVSRNGDPTSNLNPGSTQGEAILYLVTATPV